MRCYFRGSAPSCFRRLVRSTGTRWRSEELWHCRCRDAAHMRVQLKRPTEEDTDMRKHWVSAVVVVALALAMTVPAWAGCKVQAALTGPHGTGTAEKKVQAASLKAAAVNKFEVDVSGAGNGVIYAVMVSTNTTSTFPIGFTTVGAFLTN